MASVLLKPSSSITHLLPTTTLLTLLALFLHPVHALSVSKQAAIGIGVGFGFLLGASAAALLYLKCARGRPAERRAFREGADPGPSRQDAIALHAREGQRGFDIWSYDHKAWVAKREAGKAERQRGPVEEVA